MRMRASGVRSSWEAFASSALWAPTSSSMRAGGAVEALGEPRHLVAALDLHARREIARARGTRRRPAGAPAARSAGARPDRPRRRRRPPRSASARTAEGRAAVPVRGSRATSQRPSGSAIAPDGGPPHRRSHPPRSRLAAGAGIAAPTEASGVGRRRTARRRRAGSPPAAPAPPAARAAAPRPAAARSGRASPAPSKAWPRPASPN